MSGEALTVGTDVVTPLERESVLALIAKGEEWMAIDGELPAENDCENVFRAMIDTRHRYHTVMPETSKSHLRKMIVLHSSLVSAPGKISRILSTSLRSSLRREYEEFESFSEDFEDMTEEWAAALDDLALALGNLNGEAE